MDTGRLGSIPLSHREDLFPTSVDSFSPKRLFLPPLRELASAPAYKVFHKTRPRVLLPLRRLLPLRPSRSPTDRIGRPPLDFLRHACHASSPSRTYIPPNTGRPASQVYHQIYNPSRANARASQYSALLSPIIVFDASAECAGRCGDLSRRKGGGCETVKRGVVGGLRC